MRARSLLAIAALVATMWGAAPAHADVGSYCGGWKVMEDGARQNACYVRDANWHIAGRGRAYYAGWRPLDQLNIAVTLQRSDDGQSWSKVVSRTCGVTDIPDGLPGAMCLTPAQYVEAGTLYRSRVFLVLFFRDGAVKTTTPTFSPITS